MAVITPNSDVILLKVPLEMDEANQLTFANVTAQYNYFNGLSGKLPFDKFTYQRKDGTLRLPALMDDIISYNYVMYRNTSYDNKWFYAFIESMEYVNDSVTAVKLKTDVWQTWQFALTYKPVLIDREHTNDDTVGANTVPEDVELGEYVINGGPVDFGPSVTDYYVVADVSMVENLGTDQTLSNDWVPGATSHDVHPIMNGLPSGVFRLILSDFTIDGVTYRDNIQQLINVYDNAGLGDAIQSVYILPKSLLPTVYGGFRLTSENRIPAIAGGSYKYANVVVGVVAESLVPTDHGDFTFTKRTTLGSFTPVNKKLLTFPYCYFNITNNAGFSATYHYEDFSTDPKFKVKSVITPSGSVKAIPYNYKNLTSTDTCLDYSVTGAKYPLCAWINDSYINWMTQNGVNMSSEYAGAIGTSVAALATGIVGGAITGGVAGAIGGGIVGALGGAGNLLNLAIKHHAAHGTANRIPDQAKGNLNSGDFLWSNSRSKFTYLPMCIKPEYATIIDQYFSQFGYKCGKVKTPNITGRRNWNYVKTIGCYIDADIPQEDLQEIKNMFDNGVTFWHNASTFADYSQANDILT